MATLTVYRGAVTCEGCGEEKPRLSSRSCQTQDCIDDAEFRGAPIKFSWEDNGAEIELDVRGQMEPTLIVEVTVDGQRFTLTDPEELEAAIMLVVDAYATIMPGAKGMKS